MTIYKVTLCDPLFRFLSPTYVFFQNYGGSSHILVWLGLEKLRSINGVTPNINTPNRVAVDINL